MLNLVKKIVKSPAVSGREDAVADIICAQMAPLCDEIRRDKLGNLIAFKRGSASDGERRKIMLAAHMDEIGFFATFIEESGFIRLTAVGGINFVAAAYTTVVFGNGTRGVLVPETGTAAGALTFDKFYVDIGAKDKKDAERRVKIGDYFVVEPTVTRLTGRRIAGRPMDDRIGCVALIETARRVTAPRDDVYYVFTVQEEVGCRGRRRRRSPAPDVAIAYDVTGTGDTVAPSPWRSRWAAARRLNSRIRRLSVIPIWLRRWSGRPKPKKFHTSWKSCPMAGPIPHRCRWRAAAVWPDASQFPPATFTRGSS